MNRTISEGNQDVVPEEIGIVRKKRCKQEAPTVHGGVGFVLARSDEAGSWMRASKSLCTTAVEWMECRTTEGGGGGGK